MVCIIVFGQRSFGKCEYFKLNENSKDYCYVRTQFFHISFIPLCPKMSYIGMGYNQILMELPELSGKSMGWAWARCLLFYASVIIAVLAGLFTTYNYSDEEDRLIEIILSWVAFAILFLAWLAVMIYIPKATPEKRQEYIEAILNRNRNVQSARNVRVSADVAPVGYVQQQVPVAVATGVTTQQPNQNKPSEPQQNDSIQSPMYDYDQGQVDDYVLPQDLGRIAPPPYSSQNP